MSAPMETATADYTIAPLSEHTGAEVLCQVHDSGRITDPLAGRVRHGPDDRGHGLWLVNQVCDLVELRSGDAGTTVRIHLRRGL